jgi:predicted ester cyclase
MEGGPPDLPAGQEGIRVLFAHIGGVEQRWTIDDVIAEGDKVVVRATNHCEQDSFFGVPGRGIVQVFTATFTMQIADGLVAQIWRNAADLQRLFQLGARILPPATMRPSMP